MFNRQALKRSVQTWGEHLEHESMKTYSRRHPQYKQEPEIDRKNVAFKIQAANTEVIVLIY